MPIVKMLKSGETDINSTDIWRFAFHSGYKTFKISTSGKQQLTMVAGSSEASHDVVHNQNGEPMYFSNILWGTKAYQVSGDIFSGLWVLNDLGWDSAIRFYSAFKDKNTLTIGAYTADGSGVDSNQTFTIYWVIGLDEY